MKLIGKMVEYFTRLNKRMKRWQRVVSVLSAIVVFVTTYALILPAITLDVDTASTQAGIEVASENEPDAAGTVYESAEEEADDGSSEEEEITESSDNGSAVTESSTQEDAEEADAADTSAAEASAAATTSKAADTVASTAASTAESVIADTAAAASTEEAPALITEATQLTYQGKDYIVYADFDGSAQLPVGVELKAKEITKESDPEAYEVYYKKALEELKDKYDENTGLSFAKFYDISFVFKGQEVEPKGNVNIKIEYKEAVEIEEQTKVDTIHFNKEDEEKAEIIDSEKEVKDETKVESVEFESDKFSVYGVIGTETFTEKYLTEDGETYNISVTAGAEAHIPADAHLEISEVKEGSDKYDELFAKAQAAVTDGKDASVPFARFFDISIVKDGEKIQPDAPVEVKITFDETVEADKNAKFNAVHITDNGADVIDVETEGEESEKAVTVDAVQFSAEGFSIYGVTYTVDFEYTDPITGKTYYYSIDGESSINLSDLLVVLGIKSEDEAAKFVAEEVTNVEFSDSELVKVTQKGKTLGLFGKEDWLLESLKPFDTEETLTISLKDGGEIVVKVTDAQHSDISSLLSSIDIKGTTKDSEGNYTVFPGTEYTVNLRFEESSTETFSRTGSLTYHLPAGVNFPDATSGTIIPPDADLANIYSINYTVTKDGTITFTWDIKPGKEEEFEKLPGLFIGLDIKAVFDENQKIIDWGGKAQITVDQTHDVGVKKESRLGDDGYMYYTVDVKSTGENKDIQLTDTISGTALKLDQDSISGNHGATFSNKSDKGFDVRIPELKNGETATITYRAIVDYDVLAKEAGVEKGKYGTVTTTGNQIKINGKKDDNPDNDQSETHADHSIDFSGAKKTVSDGSFDADKNKRIMDWHIEVNEKHLTTISYIHDVMKEGKEKMSYSGEGITVRVVNPDGSTAATFTVPWSELGVNKNSKEWTYNIPNQYKNKNYSFVIDYSTEADVSESIQPLNVSNDVETDYDKTEGTGKADPSPGSKLDMEKAVVNADIPGGKVTWAITVDVPAGGLDTCVVTDSLPTVNGSLGHFTDGFDESSFDSTKNITGLIDGESVSVNTSEDGKIIFTFLKNGKSGLYPVEGGRKVTITLTTTLDEDWMALETDRDDLRYYNVHTNNAKVVANNYEIEKSASVTVNATEPEMIKKADAHYTDSFHWKAYGEENNLEAWMYRLYLYGISDDTFENGYLEITDTFDDRYLAYYDPDNPDVFVNHGEIAHFHQKLTHGSENGNYNDPVDIVATVENGTITFRIPKSAFQNSSGGYDRYYHVSYFLHVKDKDTIQKMNEDALKAGGILKIKNTAVWEYSEPTNVEVEYKIPIISKDYSATDEEKAKGIYHFEIKINEKGEQLGEADYLEVTDSYTNLTIDYATLECDPEDALLSYNHKGNTVTYFVKNGVPVTLRYTASALNDGEFSNTVEVNGQSVTKSGTAEITSRGTTGARRAKIKILKHSGSNLLETISGVQFELYLYDENFPEKYNPEQKVLGGTYTTDDNGMFTINNIPLLEVGGKYTDTTAKYVLHEVAAPEGYKVLPHDYVFTVDTKTANYGQYIYLNDDTLPISNEPEEEDEVSITVKKLWPDGDADLPELIRVHLYQKDKKTDPASSAREVDVVEMTRGADGTWSHTFTGLHPGKAYFVKEDPVPGFKVTYSGNNILGLEKSGEITITNTKTEPEELTSSVIVQKKWMQGEKEITDITQKEDLEATVELVRYRSEQVGTTLHFINANSNVDTTSILLPRNTPNITVNIDSIAGGNDVVYSSSYDPLTLDYQLSTDKNISESPLREGITSISINTPDVSDIYAISRYGNITSLSVSTDATIDSGDDAFIDPTYTTPETVTLNRSNGWRASFTELPTTGIGSDDGKAYSYTYGIRETGTSDASFTLEAYSVGTYEGEGSRNASNPVISGSTVTVTNKKEAPKFGSLMMTKVVEGTEDTSKEFEFEIALTAPEGITLDDSYEAKKNGEPVEKVTVSGNKITGIKLKAGDNFEILNLPEGTLYSVTEKNLPAGYKEGQHENSFGSITSEGQAVVNVTMKNIFETTDFEFSKEWRDASGNPVATWQDDVSIKVKVQRKIGLTGTTEDVGSYEIKKTSNGFEIKSGEGTPALTNESGTFTFKLSNLQKNGVIGEDSGEFTYFAIESEPVSGYKEPTYSNSGASTGADAAYNGGKIINRPVEAYELPESGGFGTTPFYTIGLLLIAFAAGLYTYFNKKKLIAIRSDRRSSGTGRGKSRRRGGDGL